MEASNRGLAEVSAKIDSRNYDVSFRRQVNEFTMVTRRLLPGIERVLSKDGRLRPGWNIDHIVPVYVGQELGYSALEMSAVENIQIMSEVDNCGFGDTQYSKGVLLPEQWINKLTDKVWMYRIHVIGKQDTSLLVLCQEAGVCYIKAMSAFVKNWTDDVIVDGILISRA